VQDPYPFKIILGPKNLAANGLMLPGVSGMVVAGFAVGDLTLRSVKGWITSVTFVFPDGRIHTVSASAGSHGLPSQTDSLGYLSDPYGNPFLPGRLITNAPAQVGTQLLLSAAEGAAGALATSALPTATGPPTNPSLTGVPSHWSHWLLGHSAQEATHDIRDWWQSRSQGAFDAIYVPAGRDVVINFTRQIPIDYHPNGRKLRYDHSPKTPHANAPTIRIHPDAVGLD
jgi:cell division protein ZapB